MSRPRLASLLPRTSGQARSRLLHPLTPNLRPLSRFPLSKTNPTRIDSSFFNPNRSLRSYPRPRQTENSFTAPLRDAINRLPPTSVVIGIVAVNGIVFMLWQGAKGEAKSGNWTEIKWMRDTFLSSGENIRNGRYWVLLTSCFSHEGLGHLLFNCFTFYFVGQSAIQILGNTRFLGLYLGAGVFGNVISYIWHEMKGQRHYASHGASGAVYGVLSFFACVAPTAMFYLYGIIPIPAFVIVPGILAWDTWSTVVDKKSNTDHSGHVGGIVGGLMYYLLRYRVRF